MSLPVVDYLKLPDGEEPYLEGHKCTKCGSIFLGERNVCSNCFARDSMEATKLSNNLFIFPTYRYTRAQCTNWPTINDRKP